jgi:hypothetical protein
MMRGRYLFCIAFENAAEYDWVTEKVYEAIGAGCIPIYRGAHNLHEHLPLDYDSRGKVSSLLIEVVLHTR